jgi:hypothetical protein
MRTPNAATLTCVCLWPLVLSVAMLVFGTGATFGQGTRDPEILNNDRLQRDYVQEQRRREQAEDGVNPEWGHSKMIPQMDPWNLDDSNVKRRVLQRQERQN